MLQSWPDLKDKLIRDPWRFAPPAPLLPAIRTLTSKRRSHLDHKIYGSVTVLT